MWFFKYETVFQTPCLSLHFHYPEYRPEGWHQRILLWMNMAPPPIKNHRYNYIRPCHKNLAASYKFVSLVAAPGGDTERVCTFLRNWFGGHNRLIKQLITHIEITLGIAQTSIPVIESSYTNQHTITKISSGPLHLHQMSQKSQIRGMRRSLNITNILSIWMEISDLSYSSA